MKKYWKYAVAGLLILNQVSQVPFVNEVLETQDVSAQSVEDGEVYVAYYQDIETGALVKPNVKYELKSGESAHFEVADPIQGYEYVGFTPLYSTDAIDASGDLSIRSFDVAYGDGRGAANGIEGLTHHVGTFLYRRTGEEITTKELTLSQGMVSSDNIQDVMSIVLKKGSRVGVKVDSFSMYGENTPFLNITLSGKGGLIQLPVGKATFDVDFDLAEYDTMSVNFALGEDILNNQVAEAAYNAMDHNAIEGRSVFLAAVEETVLATDYPKSAAEVVSHIEQRVLSNEWLLRGYKPFVDHSVLDGSANKYWAQRYQDLEVTYISEKFTPAYEAWRAQYLAQLSQIDGVSTVIEVPKFDGATSDSYQGREYQYLGYEVSDTDALSLPTNVRGGHAIEAYEKIVRHIAESGGLWVDSDQQSDSIGYLIQDLNQDGIPELVLLNNAAWHQIFGKLVHAIFTFDGSQAIRLVPGIEETRTPFTITTNGYFVYHDTSNPEYTDFVVFAVGDNGLYTLDRWRGQKENRPMGMIPSWYVNLDTQEEIEGSELSARYGQYENSEIREYSGSLEY